MRPGSDWRNWTVAITGMNCRPDNPGPGMAVARCLRECPEFRGRIVGLGYDALDAGLYHGGLCDSAYLLPYPSTGAAALQARLAEIHADDAIDALIPCLDAEMLNVERIAGTLSDLGIRALVPNRHQLAERAKDRLPALCERVGVNVPETRTVADPRFFEDCLDEGWTYPLVVKGIFYDAQIATSPAEAMAAFARIAAQWGYPVLVQRYIPGHEINLTALGDGAGGLIAPVMMRKRAVTDKGKAWAGITINDDALLEMATSLVAALQWTGPLEVEALKGEDGKLHLIEINPRFPAWVYLTHGVGRNLPVALLKRLAGESLHVPPPRPGTLFIRHAEELIISLDAFESILTAGALTLAVKPGQAA